MLWFNKGVYLLSVCGHGTDAQTMRSPQHTVKVLQLIVLWKQ